MRHVRDTTNLSAFSSTMAAIGDFRSFLSKCVFLLLLVAFCAGREICDTSKCPGPVAYYKELECKPVYKNPGDCCAETFDCSHVENMSRDKCYINGHEYSIGEKLRDEDANPCDTNCVCTIELDNRAASFVCGAGDNCTEFLTPPADNCFNRWSYYTCCPAERVCLKEGEKRATCVVDDRVYQDGDPFSPQSNLDLDCNCLPGYTGENVEPFCKKPNRRFCVPTFEHAEEINKRCAPILSDPIDLYFCNNPYKCQNNDDKVISNPDAKSVSGTDESKVCKFGNLTMHIGDTLNTSDSDCIKCKCEVPPIPTCIRDADCNISKSPTPL